MTLADKRHCVASPALFSLLWKVEAIPAQVLRDHISRALWTGGLSKISTFAVIRACGLGFLP